MDLNSESKTIDETSSSSPKRRRIIEQTEEEDETIKIINLNDDCLEHIFNYLDARDLLNIGQSNTRFQDPAGIVFKRKFGDDVHIYGLNVYGWIKSERIDEPQCQSLISIFGNFITSIELSYSIAPDPEYKHSLKRTENENSESLERIFDEISKHSLKSLVKIAFLDFPSGWLSRFSKPLPTVKSVALHGCDLGDGTSFLSEIFPKLRDLELKLLNNTHDDANNWKRIQFIAEETQIEKLKLKSYTEPSESIHFTNLKHFVYAGVGSSFPFTFDHLQKLRLCDVWRMNTIHRIVTENDKLIKLSLCIEWIHRGLWTSKLAQFQPEITFNMRKWNVRKEWTEDIDSMAWFLNRKSLATYIKIKRCFRDPFGDYLESKIDKNRWKLNRIDDWTLKLTKIHPSYRVCNRKNVRKPK